MRYWLMKSEPSECSVDDAAAAANAYSSAMFYAITYVLTTLGTFGVIMLLSRAGFEAENLEDFKGLNQRSPWFAMIMMVLMLSLAGVPPMMGFYAKLAVLQSTLAAGQLWLAIVAVLFSLVGAYYYLRIVKMMYFDPSAEPFDRPGPAVRVVLAISGLVMLFFWVYPGPVVGAATAAAHSLF